MTCPTDTCRKNATCVRCLGAIPESEQQRIDEDRASVLNTPYFDGEGHEGTLEEVYSA